MIKNHHLYPISSILFCMLVFFLPISKAITSILSAGLIAYSIYYYLTQKPKGIQPKFLILFFIYGLLSAVSLVYSSQFDTGLSKTILKLPIFFIPLVYNSVQRSTNRWRISFELLFIWMVNTVAVLSVINYYKNKEALDFLVLQNKPIPVMSHIYHIEFSIMLAIAILICIYRVLFYYWSNHYYHYLYAIAGLIGIYCLHVMSVRTGLLCLYIGFSVLLIYYILQTKKYWILIAGVILMFSALGLGYRFSESFRNRITLTLDDINVLQTERDRNWHSVSMRVDAFNNGLDVFTSNWVMGVGIGDVDTAVQAAYIENDTRLQRVNRKKPHHQFLENGIQSGFLSPILLLAVLLIPMLYRKYRNPLLVSLFIVFMVSMQFESILERQSTVVVFVLFYCHALGLSNKLPDQTI